MTATDTLGHASHPIETVLDLLRRPSVDVLADQCTVPHARRLGPVRTRST